MTMGSNETAFTVEVDRTACEGHALCLVYAPEAFEIDDEEKAVLTVDPVPSELWAAVEEAASNCPVQAILLRAAGR